MKRFWKFIYTFWSSVLRAYEVFFHHHRQKFLIGHLKSKKTAKDLKKHLTEHGFEHAFIALKDPGEEKRDYFKGLLKGYLNSPVSP